MQVLKKDKLNVYIADNTKEMGQKAAADIASEMRRLSLIQDEIRMMFAAAPSQDATIEALLSYSDLPWEKVVAFHMDEYIGISSDQPQSFRNYLSIRLFDKVPFKKVNLIAGDAPDIEKERTRYENLLKERNMDIIILGIGENGHIAFNDPPGVDFNDTEYVRIIKLSEQSRNQQVHDGCFQAIEKVPFDALTVTVPVFISAKALFCSVPNERKAEAVRRTLNEEISPSCPASILKMHPCAFLYLDSGSASLL